MKTTLTIGDKVTYLGKEAEVTHVYETGEAVNIRYAATGTVAFIPPGLMENLTRVYRMGDVVEYDGRRAKVLYTFGLGHAYDIRFEDNHALIYVYGDMLKKLKAAAIPSSTGSFTSPTAPATPGPADFQGVPVLVDKKTSTKVNVPEAFVRAAATALKQVLAATDRFTTDDLWAKIPTEVRTGVEPRAMGGFMIEAAKTGRIKKTSDYRKSTRKECHSRPLAVWARV